MRTHIFGRPTNSLEDELRAIRNEREQSKLRARISDLKKDPTSNLGHYEKRLRDATLRQDELRIKSQKFRDAESLLSRLEAVKKINKELSNKG